MVTTCEMQLHLSEGERRKIGVSFSAVSLEEGPQTSKSSEEETMIPQASRSSEDVLMMDLLNECREVPEAGAVTAGNVFHNQFGSIGCFARNIEEFTRLITEQ